MRVSKIFVKAILLSILLNTSNVLFPKSIAFFSPKDKISEKLLRFINSAQSKIYAAVYILTDQKIADALIRAKVERNIDVQIVTDQTCLESKYGKVNLLKENGIDIFIFKSNLGKKKQSSEIMHNKFAIFDNKVWTGSFNWTIRANNKNCENVLCSDDDDLYQRYNNQFAQLKEKCIKKALNKYSSKKDKAPERLMAKSKKVFNGLKGNVIGFFKNVKNKLIGEKKERQG